MTLEQKIKNLPQSSGVYIMKDSSGNIIYIGKAKVLKNRVSQYFNGAQKPQKVSAMVSKIADFDYIITNNELDALILECNLIKKHKPHYNILLKDGKNYSYIRIDLAQEFPKLEAVRKVKKDKAKYFGPYFNGITAKELIKLINFAFPIRQCNANFSETKKLKRACLNYSMGLCKAPCIGAQSSQDYHSDINKVIDFLNGKDSIIYDIINNKMQKAANLENFELAIMLRDKLLLLDKMKQKAVAALTQEKDIDVIATCNDEENIVISLMIIRSGKMIGLVNYLLENMEQDKVYAVEKFIIDYYTENPIYPKLLVVEEQLCCEMQRFLEENGTKIVVPQKGEKLSLIKQAQNNAKDYFENNTNKLRQKQKRTFGAMEELKNVLSLKNKPKRIECYDISNTSGTNSVASMVVFNLGEKASKHYRKFKIKTVIGPNDFASLQEVITRRLERLKDSSDISFSAVPDLMVIDGGKGQISATRDIIKSYNANIDVISLAEKEEEIFVEDNLHPIILSKDSYALKLLQAIRDEAHRFALTFHKSLRNKKQTESILDKIPGVGKTRKKLLIEKFGTVNKIKKCTIYDLMRVDGITEQIAQNILNTLNK